MIKIKFTMVDDEGKTIEIEREYEGKLLERGLDEAESLICEIEADLMPESEKLLLELNQNSKKKFNL